MFSACYLTGISAIVGFSNTGYLLCDLIFSSCMRVCLSSFPLLFHSMILPLYLVHFMGWVLPLWFVHSHSEFYLYYLFFLHGMSLISAFSLFLSHLVKWVSVSFSAAYLTIFLSVSLYVFLSCLPHNFLSVSSYGFFLCVGFYPWSDYEFTLQVWIVSYSTWLSKGISMTECPLC